MRYLWLGLILGITACSDSVDPIIDSGRPYTVFGFFDAHADTQAVRVFEIAGSLELINPAPLNAIVSSVDIGSGTEHQWQESVVEFENGRFGHVYWAGFRAEYEKSYRLILERPDNANTSSVEVMMPPLSSPVRLAPVLAVGYAVLPILWENAPRLHDIRVEYLTNFGTYHFDYPLEAAESTSEGVEVVLALSKDAREIFADLNRANIPIASVRLLEARMTVLVSSSDWHPPGGVYDPSLLIEPGTFSNVENGFGFVGAGYDATLAFDPPDSVKIFAGFPVN